MSGVTDETLAAFHAELSKHIVHGDDAYRAALTAALAHGRQGVAEPVARSDKIDGAIRGLERIKADFNLTGANATTVERAIHTLRSVSSPSADQAEVERLREQLAAAENDRDRFIEGNVLYQQKLQAAEAELARLRQEREWQPINIWLVREDGWEETTEKHDYEHLVHSMREVQQAIAEGHVVLPIAVGNIPLPALLPSNGEGQ